jgi:hypothetical protein
VFNIINCSQSFCDIVYLLRDRYTFVLPSFQSFECPCRCYFDPNQTKNQIEHRLCKDDCKQIVLEIYFFTSSLKGRPAPISLSLTVFLLVDDIHCISYLSYLFVIFLLWIYRRTIVPLYR